MKLRDIFQKVSDYASGDCVGEIQDYLNSIGATYLDEGCFSQAWKLVLPWGAVVIKFADNSRAEGCNQLWPEDAKQYPLLWRRYIKPIFSSEFAMIQPLAMAARDYEDADSKAKWYRRARNLEKWLMRLYGQRFDAHTGNVGIYRGKMMIFDPLVDGRQKIDGSSSYHSSNGSY